jgi:hypothetical protein
MTCAWCGKPLYGHSDATAAGRKTRKRPGKAQQK